VFPRGQLLGKSTSSSKEVDRYRQVFTYLQDPGIMGVGIYQGLFRYRPLREPRTLSQRSPLVMRGNTL
jgi:hypothetical protein